MMTTATTSAGAKAWLSITEAAALVGRSRDNVWSWIRHGVETPAGRVKLQARKLGGFWETSQEWIDAFIAACTGDGQPVAAETPTAEARRARREQEKLRKALGGKA